MKVLVISHNVFSDTENMGKTLSAYFNGWDISEIAQFYIHSEVPTTANVCVNYFRITDLEAIKSIFFPKVRKDFRKTGYPDGKSIAENRYRRGCQHLSKRQEAHPLYLYGQKFSLAFECLEQ